MEFIVKWIVFYAGVMFAMSTDNIFWISASPEYPEFKKYSLKEKLNYVVNYRIKTVLTNWRDIVPAIITSFILGVFL